jgi:hypothetical protein
MTLSEGQPIQWPKIIKQITTSDVLLFSAIVLADLQIKTSNVLLFSAIVLAGLQITSSDVLLFSAIVLAGLQITTSEGQPIQWPKIIEHEKS